MMIGGKISHNNLFKEKKMTSKKISIGMLMTVLAFGLVLIGCASSSASTSASAPAPSRSRNNERVSWSEYPPIPAKDYIVVGVVILREADPATLSADLMQKAVEMGAHDIINVRIDDERGVDNNGRMRRRVVAATAVAIKYTNETLTFESLYLSGTDNQTETPNNNQQSQSFLGGFLPGGR